MAFSENNIQQVCRVCLCESISELSPLFPSPLVTSVTADLAKRILLCTGVAFRRNQSLPQNICAVCLDELETADKFRVKCLTSDQLLTRHVRVVDKNNTALTLKSSFDPDESVHESIKIVKTEAVPSDSETDTFEPLNPGKREPKSLDGLLDDDNFNILKEPIKTIHQHICQECGKSLKTEASLTRHTISMHKGRKRVGRVTGHGSERRFHCTECSYTSCHSQSLVYHMRRHTGERPHRCECGQAFTQPSSLAAHRKTHSDVTYYTCPECGKQFKHKDVYERHKSVHSVAKFSCAVCGKGLKSQHTLDAHMNRHLGLKNFSCETCGAAFVTSVELINHRKKHDGTRRFQCHLCSYKTYLKKLLVVHIKRHTGEREFKCELCAYDCHTRHELASHQRRHSKEKRYPCAVCGQCFVYSTSLNKHMLRRHSLNFVWSSTVDRRQVKAISQQTLTAQLNNAVPQS